MKENKIGYIEFSITLTVQDSYENEYNQTFTLFILQENKPYVVSKT
jgi:hypothetical protein